MMSFMKKLKRSCGNAAEIICIKAAEIILGETWGNKARRLWVHQRSPLKCAIPWEEYKDEVGITTVIDNNVDISSQYCPICDCDQQLTQMADQVLDFQKVYTRKILHSCNGCGFLFSNENQVQREDYFSDNPYKGDNNGIRSQREIDLVMLAMQSINCSKNANILIYAMGKNTTVADLRDNGFNNVWGSDISDGLGYGERKINIATTPNYFADNDIKFEIIICSEVWEHYSRESMNSAFNWIFSQLSETGMVLGTTALWQSQKNDDPIYNLPFEWGKKKLERWFYMHPEDHTSFYRKENLKTLGSRYNMCSGFSYFLDGRVHIAEPSKSIIAFMQNNHENVGIINREIHGQHHDVFYY